MSQDFVGLNVQVYSTDLNLSKEFKQVAEKHLGNENPNVFLPSIG